MGEEQSEGSRVTLKKRALKVKILDLMRLKSFVAGCLLLVLGGCLSPANTPDAEMADMVVPTPKISVPEKADVSPGMLGDGEHPVAQVDTKDAEKVKKEGEEDEEKETKKRSARPC